MLVYCVRCALKHVYCCGAFVFVLGSIMHVFCVCLMVSSILGVRMQIAPGTTETEICKEQSHLQSILTRASQRLLELAVRSWRQSKI